MCVASISFITPDSRGEDCGEQPPLGSLQADEMPAAARERVHLNLEPIQLQAKTSPRSVSHSTSLLKWGEVVFLAKWRACRSGRSGWFTRVWEAWGFWLGEIRLPDLLRPGFVSFAAVKSQQKPNRRNLPNRILGPDFGCGLSD